MKQTDQFDFARRIVKALAAQYGDSCEIVLHDLTGGDTEHTIIAIENGHITGRRIGDGPSKIALEALQDAKETHSDKLAYLTKTRDGKILKSSTVFIRNEKGKPIGILLDSLIEQSIRMVGKPASLMDKSEKIRAIRYLNDSGAFLITKSGPKVCQVFGISKYTLYSYLDEARQSSDNSD